MRNNIIKFCARVRNRLRYTESKSSFARGEQELRIAEVVRSDASKFAYSTVAFLRVDTGSAVHIQQVQSKVRIAPCGKKEITIASRNVRVAAWILRFIHNISNVDKLRGNLVYEEFKKAENLVFKSMQLRPFQDEKFLAKMQAFKDEEGLLRIRTKLVDSDEKEDFKFPVLLPANDVVVKLIREEHKKAKHADDTLGLDLRSLLSNFNDRECTKRNVLHNAAKLFDLSGFLSPFLIRIKCLLQELWQFGIGWNEVFTGQIKENFQNWCKEIKDFQN
ncbi:integrase_H2C2 domain-containing protein [Nephila pilipes]|uniref:Integrase_H2C2 domain-containing protein n=1 Tax=Nephila pilipes TaxID=299642 RepID=A0A8X6UJQ9_NEPPI|nr:integrase_H2C2 domain-containing protein [Nephila pilipes]